MDRKNYKILGKNETTGYSLLLTNKNRTDCCLIEANIIASINENEFNKRKTSYTKIVDCFACIGVFEWKYNICYLLVVTSAEWITKINETDIFKIVGVQFIEFSGRSREEPEILELHKLLESGFFYFGKGIKGKAEDISVNIQNSYLGKKSDHRFVWNKYLIAPFENFQISPDWFNGIICGSFLANTIYSSSGHIKICIISRVSCQRVGTRFQTRGIDDFGNVANFIETEQSFVNSDGSLMASYIQIRGSVPLFWEQPGLQVGSHKITFSRNLEMSTIAYENHFNTIRELYHRVMIVNLLGSKEGERNLSARYTNCHKESLQNTEIKFVSFDYHREMSNKSSSTLSNIGKLKSQISEFVEETHFCWIINGEMVQKQYGVIRTNCVDCLDRTNAVQTMIGCDLVLEKQFNIMIQNQKSKFNSILENFKNMWKTNGDNVSVIYAGSGALGVGSKFIDAQKSVKRTYQATFTDTPKQKAMLRMLRPNYIKKEDYFRAHQLFPENLLNIDERCLEELVKNNHNFTDMRKLRVFVGTWNVNGGKNFTSIAHKNESVSDWLLDLLTTTRDYKPELVDQDVNVDVSTDIFAIGFQEIVDLTAGNIVSAKTGNQQQWAQYLLQFISTNVNYVLLSTIQLVGICLYVFIKARLAPHIYEVSTSSVKTGFKGTAGNKGAVGIRFQLYNSSFCFICSHFAAGQSNFKERNEDYQDIIRQLKFSRDRLIDCHDFIFWCGDFNYRIDMNKNDVKQLIQEENWEQLEQADQLYNQRINGNVFSGFSEGRTRFAPTYKYDLFCDDYDTSEKCRVPAWTDRILWKVNISSINGPVLCKQLMYNRAELKTSDHRPVAAIFEVNAIQVNQNCKEYIYQTMLKYGPRNSNIRVQLEGFSLISDVPDDILDLMINQFTEIGKIVLVRSNESDLILTYNDSKFILEAIDKFDQKTLRNTDMFLTVKPYDINWQEDLKKLVNESKIANEIIYPPLLKELLKDDQNRQSILSKDEFFNDDDDDIKLDSNDSSHNRARSCSPPKDLVRSSDFLKPCNLGDQTNSCTNLSEKSLIDTNAPKRPPPLRPPPINKSDLNMNSKQYKVDPEEDLLGLFDEPNMDTLNLNNACFLPENNSVSNLQPPLIPMRAAMNRPLPPVPAMKEDESVMVNRALNRPLPQIPPPPQVCGDVPRPVPRKPKYQE